MEREGGEKRTDEEERENKESTAKRKENGELTKNHSYSFYRY